MFRQLPIDRQLTETEEQAEQRLLAKYSKSKRFGRETKYSYQVLADLAGFYMFYHRHADAERVVVQILRFLERRYGFFPHPDYPYWLHAWSNVCRYQEKFDEAEGHSLNALALTQSLLSEHHYDIARLLERLADTYFARSEHLLAGSEYLRAIDELNRQKSPAPLHLADLHEKLAYVYSRARERDKAERNMRIALSLRRANLHPNSRAIANSHRWFAAISVIGDRFARAVAYQRMYLRIVDRLGAFYESEAKKARSFMILYLRVHAFRLLHHEKLRASTACFHRMLEYCKQIPEDLPENLNSVAAAYFRELRELGMKEEAKDLRRQVDIILREIRERTVKS